MEFTDMHIYQQVSFYDNPDGFTYGGKVLALDESDGIHRVKLMAPWGPTHWWIFSPEYTRRVWVGAN